MTIQASSPPSSDLVSCEVCLKVIPLSAAVDFEVGDYVAHFCGLECYAQWKGRDATEDEGEASSDPS